MEESFRRNDYDEKSLDAILNRSINSNSSDKQILNRSNRAPYKRASLDQANEFVKKNAMAAAVERPKPIPMIEEEKRSENT